jgi:hypothetical protein
MPSRPNHLVEASVTSPQTEANGSTPEFLRLPRPGKRCFLTGLSRTTLLELVTEGHVNASYLRKRNALRGIWLIHRESLLAYLRSQRVEARKGQGHDAAA